MFQAGLSSYRRSRFGWLGLGLVAVVWLTLAPIAAAEAAAGQRPELSAEIEAVRSALENSTTLWWPSPTAIFPPSAASSMGMAEWVCIFSMPPSSVPFPTPWRRRYSCMSRSTAASFIWSPSNGSSRSQPASRRARCCSAGPSRAPWRGHTPLLPAELHHYDFHAWIFKENPAGLFHHTNPTVKCVGKSPYALEEEAPPMVPNNN